VDQFDKEYTIPKDVPVPKHSEHSETILHQHRSDDSKHWHLGGKGQRRWFSCSEIQALHLGDKHFYQFKQ